MNVPRPTLTPNRLTNFPFPIKSLKRSLCCFPLTESSFTSDRKNDYCDKRNGQTSTECNTRDSIITVDQATLKISNNLEQIKDYVLQNLESLPQKQLPTKLIDAQSHETKFCSSLKAIKKPQFHHELFVDSDSRKKNNNKDSYYEIKKQKNEEFIKTTKSIQTYPLLPGDSFSLHSFFPQKIVDAYEKAEKQKPVHFVHGYFSSIDCLYFVVQKHLFLHFPIGSRLSFRSSENTIEMQFSSMIYSIKDTTVCLNGKEEIDVLIVGHQFHFELYRINETQKNPLIKLDLKYNTSNFFLPIVFTSKNGIIYYLPDNETTNLTSIDLRTGQVSNIQSVQATKKSNSQKGSIQSIIRKAWEAKNQLTWQTIREKLNQKLANSLLYDSDNWALKIGAKHCLKAKNLKMISCAASNITFIICLIQIKYVGVLGKYLKASDESLDRNAKTRKLVRVYWKQKEQVTMNYDHIQFDDTKIDILDIRTSKETRKENEQFFQIILLNKQSKKIVQKYYCIKQQIQNSSICQIKINCTQSCCFMKNLSFDFKMTGYENDRSFFNQGVSLFQKQDKRILVINNNLLELAETFNKVDGEYVGVTTSNVLDPSLIVTLGSDEGFVRVFELTFLQWVFSAIQLELLSNPQRINIEAFAEKLLINYFHASNRQSQNRRESLLHLTAPQTMKYLIQLMTNLTILTNFRQDREKQETLKFTALIKNVVTIKYLPISHHVNDLSISLISHYSLNFKSILHQNGITSNFKLSHQKNNQYSINQITDFIHQKIQTPSQSKSFSPIHKLTHSNQQDEQEANQQIEKEKDSNIPVQPYKLSAEMSDPNMIIQQAEKDQDQQISLKNETLFSSPQRQRQKHDDFNKTVKSIYKTNKTSQCKQISGKVETIQQRLFPQQNKCIKKLERDKNDQDIASAINRFCVANALVKIMSSVWTKPIGQISINTIQLIIDQINCLKNLGQQIGEYIIPKQNQHSVTNEPLISAFEDQDLSKIRYQSRQIFENKLIYSSLCETLELTKMIGYLCPNIILREAYNEHPWKFAEFLFVEFMQDYDSMLLDAWDAQMHRYINCKFEPDQNPHLNHMSLKFWLQLYILICPVHSKTKVTKMIQNSAPNNEKFISQQRVISFMEEAKSNKQKIKEVYIVIPQFFIDFLQTNKGLTQADIQYCFID